MNTLYIGYENTINSISGGGAITKRNLDYLKKIFGSHLFTYQIKDRQSENKFSKLIRDLSSFTVGGVYSSDFRAIEEVVEQNEIVVIFLDSSSFGRICKKLASKYPSIQIFCFSHNVEFILEFHLFFLTKGLRHLFKSFINLYSEILIVKYTSVLICTTEYDLNYFKRRLGAKCDLRLLPVSVPALNLNLDINLGECHSEGFSLFVGSDFAPNKHGILWYIKHVLPNVSHQLLIVGKGMSSIKNQVPKSIESRVRILDYVENLDLYYRKCDLVVAPIFYGSGMKVKVAEAITYNKPIFLTRHAYRGYEMLSSKYPVFICDSVTDFSEGFMRLSAIAQNCEFCNEIAFTHDVVFDTFKKILIDYE